MSECRQDATESTGGLTKDSELPKYRPTVVVDALAREPIGSVERVDSAERELETPRRSRQSTPGAAVRTADDDLENDRIARHVTVLNVNREIGQRPHQLRVVRPHPIQSSTMIVPWLVVISRRCPEGCHHCFEVVPVLGAHVFFYQRDACVRTI